MNSFNPELQLNELIELIRANLLSELKKFIFVTALALDFEKIERDDKTKCDVF